MPLQRHLFLHVALPKGQCLKDIPHVTSAGTAGILSTAPTLKVLMSAVSQLVSPPKITGIVWSSDRRVTDKLILLHLTPFLSSS